MNPSGGAKASSMPGMIMPGDPKPKEPKSMPGMDIPANPKPTSNNSPTGKTSSQNLLNNVFGVSGNCEQCKERIETAAKSVSGVSSAEWITETKMLHVQFDGAKTNPDVIQKAIAQVGHDTEKYKATDIAYKELPECCLYRK